MELWDEVSRDGALGWSCGGEAAEMRLWDGAEEVKSPEMGLWDETEEVESPEKRPWDGAEEVKLSR